MTITIYRSTDGSAPTLTGQAGSLINVLDGCLVNGYGAKSSAGWTKAWAGTNLATYQQGAGTNGFFLAVDDTNAQNSRLRLFETAQATGVASASGTNATPTDTQVSGGLYAYKSLVADGTARPWTLFTNNKIIYFFWQYSGVTTTQQGIFFGDFVSYKYGDVYGTILVSNTAASATGTSIKIGVCSGSFTTVDAGWCVPRAWHQLAGAIQMSRCSDAFRSFNATEFGSNGETYPSPVTSGITLAPIWIGESGSGVRGHLSGLWAPMHARPLVHGDTFNGTGNLAGKTFEAVNIGNAGQLILETSDTWS